MNNPLVEQGAVNPRALAVLGAWFLTTEIELSLALCKNVSVVNVGGSGVFRRVKLTPWLLRLSESLVACARVVHRLSVLHTLQRNTSKPWPSCSDQMCLVIFLCSLLLMVKLSQRVLWCEPLSVWQEGVENLCWMIWDGEPLVDTQLV